MYKKTCRRRKLLISDIQTMNRKKYILIFIALFSLISCAPSQKSIVEESFSKPVVKNADSINKPIARNEVIAIAEKYLKHKWQPTKKNIFHGFDKNHIRVDTPDIDFSLADVTPGWWIPNKTNVGLPYMWGGYCSIEEFDNGIREGKYAGDVYTQYKRNNSVGAKSNYAVGIDCSGFISRCWKLPYHHSTRDLPKVAYLLSDIKELREGDILNKPNEHVILFKEFHDKQKTIIIAYHATSHKVKKDRFFLPGLIEEGFKPYRYKNIID